MRPGDVAIVHPAKGQGCPCEHAARDWHEGLFADGFRQRAGICPMLRELITTRAGCVSQYCPVPSEVGGEIYRPERVEWGWAEFIPYERTSGPGEAPAPVKGAAEGSRDLIPMLPRQEDASSLVSSPAHRERITLTDGEAASSSCLDPPRARRPNPSGRWFE